MKQNLLRKVATRARVRLEQKYKVCVHNISKACGICRASRKDAPPPNGAATQQTCVIRCALQLRPARRKSP